MPKRKAVDDDADIAPSPKRSFSSVKPLPDPVDHDYDQDVVLRKYYPSVLSNARCKEYSSGERDKPIDELTRALRLASNFRSNVIPGETIIHWFRRDLRVEDNTALHEASKRARDANVALLTVYLISPQDYEAHLDSPAKVEFILRSLEVVKKDLEKLDIPLWVETVEKRKTVPDRILKLAEEWRAKHVYANMEYEVDELRRDAKVVQEGQQKGIAVDVLHDSCVVPPSILKAKSSGQAYAVYSPWYRAWCAHLVENPDLLKLLPNPAPNPPSARETYKDIFASSIPRSPSNKILTITELRTVHTLFPAGSHEAQSRLHSFISNKAKAYSETRNFPAKPGTSSLSVHLTNGTLSARTTIYYAKKANRDKLVSGSKGIDTWISEVAWRDFYRHILVAYPYICMNKPFKPEYASVEWQRDEALFEKWKNGQTGYPLVDAAMRQLSAQKWLPNRVRMVVASFLCKDLHLDWRLGEKYFMEQLIDGDFASNNGGWGFSSSCGVDPQPYFRVFNPTRQSETFDLEGTYIRTWVKELKGVKGKEVHDPSKECRHANGYPVKCVEHDAQRKRAIEIYKEGSERGKMAP